MWKTLKGMKNHSLSKNGMFLLCSDLYYVRKRCHTCTIRMFFLKERPYFLHSYLINFLVSSLNIYLGSYPKIQLYVPFIIWEIWLSTKIGVKSLFSYFEPFHSCAIICWLEDRDCANVALGPMGRWLCHCLGNSPWTLRRTSGVLWLIQVLWNGTTCIQPIRGVLITDDLRKSLSPFLWVFKYHVRCISYFLLKAVTRLA